MSLRWTAYVAPNPQREPQRRQFFCFPYKKWTLLEESLLQCKVSLCENCQRPSCRASTKVTHPVKKWQYLLYDLTLRGQPIYALFTISTQRPYATCVIAIRISWRLRLPGNSCEKLLYSLSIYGHHRCVYKHIAAAYNEMGTMGTNQSAVRFTDL